MLENDDTTQEQSAADSAEQPESARRSRPRRSATREAGPPPAVANPFAPAVEPTTTPAESAAAPPTPEPAAGTVAIFKVPDLSLVPAKRAAAPKPETHEPSDGSPDSDQPAPNRNRNRNRKGQKGQGGKGQPDSPQADAAEPTAETAAAPDEESTVTPSEDGESTSTTRRRRRRRRGTADGDSGGEAASRAKSEDQVTQVKGSTRLEAKKQRRREGREAGRRRAPILSEAEFLARRESVARDMVVRQIDGLIQIAVLEDDVLVEHYVTKESSGPATMVGSVFLGRVQNVLPSMEAAFIDIGRGRNAVLYAGEVNWDAAGLEGQPKRIEFALKAGDSVLVQVTKDPIGHKGARLTSQISLPGRYLVYVPDGSMTGISRRLPDTERSRLRGIIKKSIPADSGVIVRTAAEGATEEEITRDIDRLTKTWDDIQAKAKSASPTQLLHAEPDLAIRVVRDIFNEDFATLQVSGDRVWNEISTYVAAVAPDLQDRVTKWVDAKDAFAARRIDEQLAKALDRKVWLPSGGSLIIEHTEAMTVIDVNTGKFTGKGGNLEETVTQNNLEAAEEIVRQVRLRDIGGIIVIDFIDMVLENNRDLVLRRLIECLGRDRTKHQVTEVTSLGLVQMTRKRIGGGLLETFSEPCEACNGRGILVHLGAHGSPLVARRKPMKPSGAHDPIETMNRAAAQAEAQAEDEIEIEEDDLDDARQPDRVGENEEVDFDIDDEDESDEDESDEESDDESDEDESDDDESDEDESGQDEPPHPDWTRSV